MEDIENFDNFDSWNNIKKDMHQNKNRVHFRQGEIWFVSIGHNIGYEVYGKGEKFLRPVVIFRKINKNTFLAIPLTSKIKEDRFHCIIDFKDKQNSAILSQVKTIDAKRLAYKTGNLDRNVFENLEKSFVEFFDLTPLSRGGYTHQEDEQRVNEVIISKKTKQINKGLV